MYRIDEKKLNKKDSFRAQIQLPSRRDKILYAYMSEEHPDIVRGVRDYFAGRIMKRLLEHFEVMKKSNPGIKVDFHRWLEQDVDPKLRREVSGL